MEPVYRGWLESKVLVESPRLLIDCVNQHRSDRNDVGSLFNSRQRIEGKRFAESFALRGSIHRQASKNDDTDWVIRPAFPEAFRAIVLVDGAGRQRIVTNDKIPRQRDVGL